MNKLSFDIKTSVDFFKKLEEDYSEFCKDKTSSRIALNCAMTAWHLTEWIFNEYKFELKSSYSEKNDFQFKMKELCPSLQIMHDLTNGTKHYKLTRHKPKVKDSKLHKGDFSNDFSRDFNISILVIELKNGSKIYFEDAIKRTVLFWEGYLRSTLNVKL